MLPSSPPPPAAQPRVRRALAVLFFTVFLDLLGFGMIIPLLQLQARELHASVPQTGWLLAIYSIMQLVFAPIWGRLSDQVGRRPIMLLSIFGSCISQLGYALAQGFPMLLGARAAAGVCGANISAAQAYIADVTDERSRAGAMGAMGAALGLGFIFGPVLGGELARIHDRLPFFVASGLAALNFLLATALLREPERHVSAQRLTLAALRGVLSQPRLQTLMLLFFVVTFGFANMEGVFALFVHQRFGFDKQHVGRLLALAGVVMVIVQGFLVRRLAPALGEIRLVTAGTALMGGGLLLMAFSYHLPALILGMVLLAGGNGLNNPSLSALLSRRAGDLQGSVLGVAQSLGALGRILGPLLGTAAFTLGTGVPYWTAAACMGAALLIALGMK